jgi:hypothetical protein
MTDLSRAAQAVLDAFGNARDGEYVESVWIVNECAMLAAALRALDSQLGHEILGVRGVDCSQIQLIAAELEGYGQA